MDTDFDEISDFANFLKFEGADSLKLDHIADMDKMEANSSDRISIRRTRPHPGGMYDNLAGGHNPQLR
jgi:hypothetical protein